MEENFAQRQAEMNELREMLDRVVNQKVVTISTGHEEVSDIRKYSGVTYNVENNGQEVEVTKDIYEVITMKDGQLFHEFYDEQGNMMAVLSAEEYETWKGISELGNTEEGKDVMSHVMKKDAEKSLLDRESEQEQEIADAVGMDKKDIKELNIITTSGMAKDESLDEKKKEIKDNLNKYMAIGVVVDTRELATSDETIREMLQIDADKLLLVQINGDWRALEIQDDGKIHVANNLEVAGANQQFFTKGNDGKDEIRMPEIEFRRKDNPDISLAVDSNNDQNKTQLYLVAGESRSATEIQTNYNISPYASYKNQELVEKARENPDKKYIEEQEEIAGEKSDETEVDPHEPSLDDRKAPNSY